jgi:hypothetical protein
MNAAWAAVLAAAITNISGFGILAWKAGRWAGGVNASLDELRRIAKDHERRLRVLTGGRHH